MSSDKGRTPMQKRQLPKHLTQSDKLAIFINNVFGSLIFLSVFLLSVATWIMWNNGYWKNLTPFDEHPYPKLELGISTFAIVLTIAVLISQNRQRRIEKLREELEFEINLKAEKEITQVLRMLTDIQTKMGIKNSDIALNEMQEDTNLEDLHDQIERS